MVGDLSPLVNSLAAVLRGGETTGRTRKSLSDAVAYLRLCGRFSRVPDRIGRGGVGSGGDPRGDHGDSDAGAHMFAATWGWRASRPREFLMSNGHATMGYAVPAGIAAALARPSDPVIAFTGDGGFLLHGNELETAARVRARLVVVVLNDSGLSLIRTKQEERNYRRTAVDFGPVDCAAFARSLGAAGTVVSTVPELRAAVVKGLRESVPTVLDVRISGDEYGELQRVIRGTGAPKRQSEESVCTG